MSFARSRVAVVVAAAAALTFVPAESAWAEPAPATFLPAVDYPVAGYTIAAGDFNGDGADDLAVEQDKIKVLLSDGSGGFGAQHTYAAGPDPNGLVAGDVNNDSHPDLVVVNSYASDVTVLLGGAHGTFGAAQSYPAGTFPGAVAIADVNLDTVPDLVVTDSGDGGGGGVQVLLGRRHGGFRPAVFNGTGGEPNSIGIGDFDGDHDPDLVLGLSADDETAVVLNDGSGGFGAPTFLDDATGDFVVADFNGDHDPDLAIGEAPNAAEWLGGPGATFHDVTGTNPGGPTFLGTGGRTIVAGDFNGDSHPDLVVSETPDDTVAIMLGSATGGFGPPTHLPVGDIPLYIAVGDFNGDSRNDVAVTDAGSPRAVSVLLHTATTWTMSSPAHPVGAHAVVNDIFCPTAKRCVAVGSYSGSGVQGRAAWWWNGTVWSVRTWPSALPDRASLSAVSCSSATSCTAVGTKTFATGAVDSRPIVEHWNGTKWSAQSVRFAKGTRLARLADVYCWSARGCTAVGAYATGHHPARQLIERANGSRWTRHSAPQPSHASSSKLNSVSCSSAGLCTAVGSYSTSQSPHERALVLRWKNSRWGLSSAADPAHSSTQLVAVDCPSAGQCIAVGTYSRSAHDFHLYSNRLRSGSWTMKVISQPASTTKVFHELGHISCRSAASCFAVGSWAAGAAPLEHWNGAGWTQESSNLPPHSTLNGISCKSGSTCFIVGSAPSTGPFFAQQR